jgi:hypothetical protein
MACHQFHIITKHPQGYLHYSVDLAINLIGDGVRTIEPSHFSLDRWTA